MQWKGAFFSAAALVIVAAAAVPQAVSVARDSGCEAGDKIDSSTADEARKKMERAGFQQVRDLKKGCDNFWHAIAVKDGRESHVVLTPQGEVMREGD